MEYADADFYIPQKPQPQSQSQPQQPQPPPQMQMQVPPAYAIAPQSVQQQQSSTKERPGMFDRMLSRKRDILKIVIAALAFAFALSLNNIFITYVSNIRSTLAPQQELAATVLWSVIILLTIWVLKSA
jgi:hypothetical protein